MTNIEKDATVKISQETIEQIEEYEEYPYIYATRLINQGGSISGNK